MLYQPMHAPQKPVSFERMQAILAKHTGHPVEIRSQALRTSRPQRSEAIRWRRLCETSILASSGQVILRTLDSSSRDIYIVFDSQSSAARTAQPLARFRVPQDAKDFVRLLPK